MMRSAKLEHTMGVARTMLLLYHFAERRATARTLSMLKVHAVAWRPIGVLMASNGAASAL